MRRPNGGVLREMIVVHFYARTGGAQPLRNDVLAEAAVYKEDQ